MPLFLSHFLDVLDSFVFFGGDWERVALWYVYSIFMVYLSYIYSIFILC